MIATLDRDSLRRTAPSVFAQSPWERVSGNYRFVPTTEVLDIMQAEGFHVTKAMQSTTRIPGKGDFTRHMLRLRHTRYLAPDVGEEIPEIVLVNSHDRSSAYKIFTGIFRLVCQNGAVIQSVDFGGFSIRHSGSRDLREQVVDTTARIVAETPAIMGRIEGWKGIDLTDQQRNAYASAALELRDNPIVTAPQLLAPRRPEDNKTDLWTTSQTVQEHLIRGGDKGRSRTGRRTSTRAVKSVSEDLRLNRALWVLTEKLAETIS